MTMQRPFALSSSSRSTYLRFECINQCIRLSWDSATSSQIDDKLIQVYEAIQAFGTKPEVMTDDEKLVAREFGSKMFQVADRLKGIAINLPSSSCSEPIHPISSATAAFISSSHPILHSEFLQVVSNRLRSFGCLLFLFSCRSYEVKVEDAVRSSSGDLERDPWLVMALLDWNEIRTNDQDAMLLQACLYRAGEEWQRWMEQASTSILPVCMRYYKCAHEVYEQSSRNMDKAPVVICYVRWCECAWYDHSYRVALNQAFNAFSLLPALQPEFRSTITTELQALVHSYALQLLHDSQFRYAIDMFTLTYKIVETNEASEERNVKLSEILCNMALAHMELQEFDKAKQLTQNAIDFHTTQTGLHVAAEVAIQHVKHLQEKNKPPTSSSDSSISLQQFASDLLSRSLSCIQHKDTTSSLCMELCDRIERLEVIDSNSLMQLWNAASDRFPTDVNVLLNQFLCCVRVSMLCAARTSLAALANCEKFGESDHRQVLSALWNQSSCHYKKKEWTKGLEWCKEYKRVVDMKFASTDHSASLPSSDTNTVVDESEGQKDAGKSDLKFVALGSVNASRADRALSILYYQLHDYKACEIQAEAAIAKQPNSIAGHMMLCRAFIAQKEHEKAVQALDRIVQIHQNKRMEKAQEQSNSNSIDSPQELDELDVKALCLLVEDAAQHEYHDLTIRILATLLQLYEKQANQPHRSTSFLPTSPLLNPFVILYNLIDLTFKQIEADKAAQFSEAQRKFQAIAANSLMSEASTGEGKTETNEKQEQVEETQHQNKEKDKQETDKRTEDIIHYFYSVGNFLSVEKEAESSSATTNSSSPNAAFQRYVCDVKRIRYFAERCWSFAHDLGMSKKYNQANRTFQIAAQLFHYLSLRLSPQFSANLESEVVMKRNLEWLKAINSDMFCSLLGVSAELQGNQGCKDLSAAMEAFEHVKEVKRQIRAYEQQVEEVKASMGGGAGNNTSSNSSSSSSSSDSVRVRPGDYLCFDEIIEPTVHMISFKAQLFLFVTKKQSNVEKEGEEEEHIITKIRELSSYRVLKFRHFDTIATLCLQAHLPSTAVAAFESSLILQEQQLLDLPHYARTLRKLLMCSPIEQTHQHCARVVKILQNNPHLLAPQTVPTKSASAGVNSCSSFSSCLFPISELEWLVGLVWNLSVTRFSQQRYQDALELMQQAKQLNSMFQSVVRKSSYAVDPSVATGLSVEGLTLESMERSIQLVKEKLAVQQERQNRREMEDFLAAEPEEDASSTVATGSSHTSSSRYTRRNSSKQSRNTHRSAGAESQDRSR